MPLPEQLVRIELDIENRHLLRNGEKQKLGEKEWAVLLMLNDRAESLIRTETIRDAIWGNTGVSSVPQSIHKIRVALGQPKEGQRYTRWAAKDSAYWIETISTVGFIFHKPTAYEHSPLPDDEVDFVERKTKNSATNYVTQLESEFTQGTHKRLINLWGLIGVGKSRIASEVGKRMKEQHNFTCIWSSARDGNYYFRNLLRDIIQEVKSDAEPNVLADLKRTANENTVLDFLKQVEGRSLIILDDFDKMDSKDGLRCFEWLRNFVPCSVLITSNRKTTIKNICVQEMSGKEAEEFVRRAMSQMGLEGESDFNARDVIKELRTTAPLFLAAGVKQLALDVGLKSISDMVFGSNAESRLEILRKQIGEDAYNIYNVLFRFFKRDASREALMEASDLLGNDRRFDAALSILLRYGLIEPLNKKGRIALNEHERHLREKELEVAGKRINS